MTRLVFLLLFAAASCGDAGPPQPQGQPKAATGRPIDLEPGSWRSRITVLELRQPSFGPQRSVAEANRDYEPLSRSTRCIRPEAALNASLADTLSQGPWRGGNCVFSRRGVTTAGVDIAIRCEGLTPSQRVDTTITGTATPRSAELVIENRSRNPRTGEPWIERYRVVSAWLAPQCESAR